MPNPATFIDQETGETHPLSAPLWRAPNTNPLLISDLPGISRAKIDITKRSIWRYAQSLPVKITNPISLGEGCTPLIAADIDGLFGGRRKRVTRQTIELVRQPYAVFQNSYGILPGFWQDEFVLGFFGVMIGLASQTLSQGRLSQTDKGYLLQDTFGAISNMNGVAITRRFADLAHQKPQSSDFQQGGDNGEIVTLAFFGKGTPKGQDAIEAAKKEAAAQGAPKDAGAVATILAKKLFVDPLVERFNLGNA